MSTRFAVLGLTLLALSCPSVAAEQNRRSHESRLPGRILGSLTLHNVSEWSERCRRALSQQLQAGGEPFFEALDRDRPIISERLREEFGITLEEWDELGLGRITVASVKLPNEPVCVATLIDFRSRELIERVVARLELALKRTGFDHEDTNLHGTRAHIFRRRVPEREFALCIRDSILCVCTSAKALATIMGGWEAEHPDGVHPEYETIVRHCHQKGREPLLTWFIHPMGFVTDFMLQEEQGDTEFRRFLQRLIPRAGLDGLKAIGGTIDAGADDLAVVARMQLVLKKRLHGALSIVHLQSDDLRPPAWIPDSAMWYRALNWDLQAFHDGWDELLAIIEGEGALDAYLQRLATVGGGFNAKREFLDRLTGRIQAARCHRRGQEHLLVGLQVRDAKVVAGMLENSTRVRFELALSTTTALKSGDQVYYRVPFGDTHVFVMLVDDTLLFAASEELIQESAKAAQRPLAESAGYKRVAAWFSARCVWQAYDATPAGMERPWEYLRTQTRPADTLGVDLSRLPSFESVREHFGPSAAVGVENESGVLLTFFSLYGRQNEH